MRPVAPGPRVELLDRRQQDAQLRPQGGVDRGLSPAVVLAGGVLGGLAGVDHAVDCGEQVAPVEPGVAADAEDLEGVQPPRAAGHHPHQGGVVRGIGDGAQGLLQVPDLGRLEQGQAADDGEWDVLGLEAVHDEVAVLVLAVQDRDVAPVPALVLERADGVHDGDGLVLATGAHVELDGAALGLVGGQDLVRREAGLVTADEAVGGVEHEADAAEVLLDGEVARRSRREAVRVVRGRA